MMKRMNMNKKYECDCGRIFTDPDGPIMCADSKHGKDYGVIDIDLCPHGIPLCYQCAEDPEERKYRFPSLEECFDYCREGTEGKQLTDIDEHFIGTTWSFIEGMVEKFVGEECPGCEGEGYFIRGNSIKVWCPSCKGLGKIKKKC